MFSLTLKRGVVTIAISGGRYFRNSTVIRILNDFINYSLTTGPVFLAESKIFKNLEFPVAVCTTDFQASLKF